MDENDKLRLRGNFRYLVGQIRVSDIRDYLFEKRVLTEDDFEELEPGRRTERNAVRVLLMLLFKKGPNAYGLFCCALKESGYEHVVKTLDETELSHIIVESEDQLDSFFKEESMVAEFQRRLWNVTEVLERYKRDVDNLKKKLRTKEEFQKSYANLEKEIVEKGYSEEFVIECLNEYMTKVQQDYTDSSLPVAQKDNLSRQASPMIVLSHSRQKICQIAIELSKDIVLLMISEPNEMVPVPNRYAKTMRKTVRLMTQTKQEVFQSYTEKLLLTEANGFGVLKQVADEMFGVGHINWGRIVALFAFGGFVARNANENKMKSIVDYTGEYLGKYVAKYLGGWIEKQGGWVCIFV